MRKIPLLFVLLLVVPIGSALAQITASTKTTTPALTLVAAINQLPGSFVTPGSAFADAKNFFLASDQGTLFIIGNGPGYPVTEIQVSGVALRGIDGDGTTLYVGSADGNVYAFNEKTFQYEGFIPLAGQGVKSVVVDQKPNGQIIVSAGQTEATADPFHAFWSTLNQGDVVYILDKQTLAILAVFGQTFVPNTTAILDRSSGTPVGTIANPANINGAYSQVSLSSDGTTLAQAIPGCCGAGVTLHAAKGTFQQLGTVPDFYSNSTTTINNGKILVVVTEAGTVDLYDITNPAAPTKVGGVNLRQATGFTGPDDIECRSVSGFMQGSTVMLVVGSSWSGKNLSVPAAFVLKVQLK